MPSVPKKRSAKTIRRRRGRRRIYLLFGVLVTIIAIGVGWIVFDSARSANMPDFAIAAPTGVTIYAGTPITSTVTVTPVNKFTGTVVLTAIGSTGLTATISPANVTGSGTATLTMSTTIAGNYTVTVSGTSGGLKHSVTPRVATPVYAKLVTSNGTIEVELYQAQTPKTVSNFVNLAESGFYNNLVWHRIVKSPNVIQTGDPNTRNGGGDRSLWGTGGSSQTVPLEIDSSLHNSAGYLGMARGQDVNSGSSQFYINVGDNNYLDGQYAVFGKVISGMSAAVAISNHPVNSPTSGQPLDPLPFLTSVTISNSP